MLGVALDAVAPMHFGERRRRVVRRTEELGVGKRAGGLHPQKVPLSPENSLDLERGKERTPFTVSVVRLELTHAEKTAKQVFSVRHIMFTFLTS